MLMHEGKAKLLRADRPQDGLNRGRHVSAP
jgi:hypothetical protein